VYVCKFVPLVPVDAELVADGAEGTDETVEKEAMELARAPEVDADADADALEVTLLVKLVKGTAELGAEDDAEAVVALAETISVFPPTEEIEDTILLAAAEVIDTAELGAREEAAMNVADTTEDVAVTLPEALVSWSQHVAVGSIEHVRIDHTPSDLEVMKSW
jgi:hypothetical protein